MASTTITLDASNYIKGYRDGWLAALEIVIKSWKSLPNGQVDWNAIAEKFPELASKFSEETNAILAETRTVYTDDAV